MKVKIPDGAFRDNSLEFVSIPFGVTEIGNVAFSNNNLSSIMLPYSLTKIGGAFAENKLTSVVIPQNVNYIDTGAFIRNKLTTVDIYSDNIMVGSHAFSYNGTLSNSQNMVPPVGTSGELERKWTIVEFNLAYIWQKNPLPQKKSLRALLLLQAGCNLMLLFFTNVRIIP